MTDPDLGFLLALIRFPKLGPVRIGKLRNHFPSYKEAFNAPREQWLRASIEPKVIEAFLITKSDLDPKREQELLERHSAHIIPFDDPRYPPLLSEIYDPPAALFVRGTLPSSELPHLAVVGSRKHTSYGRSAVEDLITPIAGSLVVVSGLALGIDALAHQAALDAGGSTIAVLGSGVDNDNIYPSQNRNLASRIIASGGAIISEFPIGTHALKQNFPFRNRIIAGLCHGALIVEAAEKSGTLITARMAMENNRDVFSIPGSIHSPMSVGTNALIKDGAIPVTQPNDILEVLGLSAQESNKELFNPSNQDEEQIYEKLNGEPVHVDELIRLTELPASTISKTLTVMELNGGARHVGGLFYVRG